jgi:pantoate--beta-alanine ligase
VAALTRLSAAGFRPEYFTARRAVDLSPPAPGDKQLILLAAAWLGGARLIDNLRIEL